jgi:hypothetical protein
VKLAALAATVFTRLTTHSRFATLLLSSDAARTPLPPSAERLPLPLTSLLPLVEADPVPGHVRRSPLCVSQDASPCKSILMKSLAALERQQPCDGVRWIDIET